MKTKEEGITLIALLITIIVLVVLATVVIVNLTGEENLIDKSIGVVESYDISQYEETIRLAEMEAKLDRIENKEIVFLDRVQEMLEANPEFKEATMKRIEYEGKDSLLIFVKNHAFVVNDDGTKYLGTTKDFNVPSAKGGLTVKKTPDTQWTTRVIITAEAKEASYEIEYSIGNEANWKKYQETGLQITENTTIYFRLNIGNVYGEAVEIVVDNIDTINPNAIIAGMPTSAYVNQSKTAVIDLTDYESGINLAKSKWVYTNSKEPLGVENLSQYTKEMKENAETVNLIATSAGTWYLHVLAVDNADNRIEKISDTGVTISVLPSSVTSGTTFGCNGGIQRYVVPATGIYKLEVWGAQGGSTKSYSGGLGGNSTGYAILEEGTVLYIGVGGAGSYGGGAAAGGFNGGGTSDQNPDASHMAGGGGGATHIAKVNGTLQQIGSANISNLLIVAGGGGGAFYHTQGRDSSGAGGSGGGLDGRAGTDGAGGTQAGGYSFGVGENSVDGAGGGGYYGGRGSTWGGSGGGRLWLH